MWLDKGSNTLIYQSTDERLTKATQGAFTPLDGYTAFPATLYNMQVARWLGFPTPSPMEVAGYDWPGRFRPYDHQIVTANFLALNPRSFCLNDMGTGKTNAAAWAADFVMQQYPEGSCRALIVAPLSILQRAWGDAIFQSLLGRRTFTILHGDAKTRRSRLDQPHDFYIINHDGFKNSAPARKNAALKDGLYKDLLMRDDIRMCIVDEASAFRDATTGRSKAMRGLLRNKDYVWPMTGSPVPNAPTDAYGIAKLVNNAKGETFTSFKGRTMYNISGFKWVPRNNGYEEAAKLLQPSIRYSIKDCIDLPPCDYLMRDAELSADQAKAHKKLRDEAVLTMGNGQVITAANEAVLRMKLIQIACGAVYGQDHAVTRIDAAPRINVCKEVVEESRKKTIIFAPLTSVLELLYSEFKDVKRALVNGSVSLKARSQIFKDFQETAEPTLLIADPGTMAHGLTLTAADTIIWYCPIDKPEIYMQANARINRPGQDDHTRIVKIAATKTEREIFRRLDNNESLQGAMLTLLKEDTSEY